MSHFPERKDKNCLNCGSEVLGRYCQVCGQENLVPKETFWHLVSHFINDITHFDGKFFSTLKSLLFRPGFLSAEYVRGRRMSYLHPVRMYVFTSAIFFVIFFSMVESSTSKISAFQKDTYKKLIDKKHKLETEMATETDPEDRASDSIGLAAVDTAIYSVDTLEKVLTATGLHIDKNDLEANRKIIHIGTDPIGGYSNASHMGWSMDLPQTLDEYDSLVAHLPANKRLPWYKNMVNRRLTALEERGREDKAQFIKDMWQNLLHTFPKILFVSIPLFAFLLWLLNIRRRKEVFYVDHGIFTIHLFCATFIIMLAIMLINSLKSALQWEWMGWITGLLVIASLFYEYKAMHNFYKQGRFKTVVKFILLNVSAIVLIGMVSLFFVAWAVLES